MGKNLQTFEKLQNLNEAEIHGQYGGKTWGLYVAHKLGILIPQTWLISICWYKKFMREVPACDPQKFVELAQLFIQQHFAKELEELPDVTFAVRSSSQFEDTQHQSFAGIFASELHVPRNKLANAIAKVWISCLSDRVVSYFDDLAELQMAIVIQPMIVAKYSGVCFSKHPAPSSVFDEHHLLIEVAQAEGEKVVQGEITPLRFSGNLVQIAASIDERWLQDLLNAILLLKAQLNYEIDMEFVVDKASNFYLVQQRPVSTKIHSKTLNLSDYFRAYKRTLWCLDIEMLITGCSDYLATYLHLPYSFDPWMVMTTTMQGTQELWLHKILNQAVISKIAENVLENEQYLTEIYQHYMRQHQHILVYPYSNFFKKEQSLQERFIDWLDFIKPINAHYYLPLFMIDALSQILLVQMRKIDLKNAEADLLKMGTADIRTLSDFLHEDLLNVKKEISKNAKWSDLSQKQRQQMQELSKKYGFLKLHQVYETGYTAEELFNLMQELEEKETKAHENEMLSKKYLISEHIASLFTWFQRWLNIRNQEMEYLMYAILQCSPLFEEITERLDITIKQLWSVPSLIVIQALTSENNRFITEFNQGQLAIYRENGKTHVKQQLKIIYAESVNKQKELIGKTVYGEGKMKAKIKLAFQPDDLKNLKSKEKLVLVTGMTTPDYVPYMKNFVGLITDEGGILCHAAILARELQIPTIVGTGIATEILHDNMTVEIDFDRGSVMQVY